MSVALGAYLIDSQYRLLPGSCHCQDPDDYWLRILTGYTQEQLLFRCPSHRAKDFVDWNTPSKDQPDGRYVVPDECDPYQDFDGRGGDCADFVSGPIRDVPFFWRLIDCSFGVGGLIALLFARGCTRKLIALEGR